LPKRAEMEHCITLFGIFLCKFAPDEK